MPMPESKGSDVEGFVVTGAAGFEEDAGVVDVFLEETSDILVNIDEFMQQWASAIGDVEIIAELRRALHNIKGGARLAGLTPVADVMHELESGLESVTEGEKEVTEELPLLVQSGLDWLVHSVEIIKGDGVVEPAVYI